MKERQVCIKNTKEEIKKFVEVLSTKFQKQISETIVHKESLLKITKCQLQKR